MADSQALRSYLIKLGVAVDDAQFRKIENVVAKTEKVLAGFAEGVAILSIAIDKYVIDMADNFDKMYYASQQMNTSVKNLQTVEFAAKMVGVSGDAAAAGLMNMARAIRMNPGLNGLLSGLGIKPGQDTASTQDQLLHKLVKFRSRAIALQYAQQFGMDPDSTNQFLDNLPAYDAAKAQRRAMLAKAGLNPDDDAKRAMQFERQMTTLNEDVDILKEIIMNSFLPAVDGLVKGLASVAGFMSGHHALTAGGGLAALFGGGWAAKKVAGWGLRKMGTELGLRAAEASEVAGGEALAGGGLLATVGSLLPPLLIIAGIATLIYSYIQNPKAWQERSDHIRDAIDGGIHKAFTATTSGASTAYGAVAAGLAQFAKHFEGNTAGRDGLFRAFGSVEGGSGTVGWGHKIQPGEHFGALTPAQADALFQSDMGRSAAAVSRLTKGMHLSKGWNDALTDFQFNTGNLAGAHTLMSLLRAGKMNAAAKSFEMYDGYHKDGVFHHSQGLMNRRLGEEAMARGVSIQQKTDIHVTGTSDPEATGRAVMRTQRHTNADLARNAAGAAG